VLAFSDLTSGPNSGNTDTSKGQASGVNGAIVSVWGLNLGNSQGNSTITVNGAVASIIYYWGDAVPPWSPANLHNGYQNMQMVILQVPNTAALGAGTITVNVNGRTSNKIPFAVRPGRIFFVSTGGKDRNRGTFKSPLRSIQAAKDVATRPGDTIYVENGVNTLTDTQGFGAAVRMNHSATQSAPIALVAYPGAVSQIGSATLEAFQFYISDSEGAPKNITLSKFTIVGTACPLGISEGGRVVGSVVSVPNGNLDTGASNGRGSNLYWLGNEWTNIGAPSPRGLSYQSLYHVLYVSGYRGVAVQKAESNRWVEWNYFHDNNATRAVNIYSQIDTPTSDLIQGHHVDHNVIINQRGDGILLGALVTGENWVYDNLILNAGLGPEPTDQPTPHTCIDIRGGYEKLDKAMNIMHVYNNTMFNCGFNSGNKDTGGFLLVNTRLYTMDIHNNIVYQTNSNLPYIDPYTDSISKDPAQWSHNLWFGSGRAPSFDSNNLNANPQFVNPGTNFHLQTISPAIDSGTNLGRSFVSNDLDGTPQPSRGKFDRGAYELP
jgi:hypothetical protein